MLFTRIFIPTSFLLVCILHLHYFHDRFLQLTDLQAVVAKEESTIYRWDAFGAFCRGLATEIQSSCLLWSNYCVCLYDAWFDRFNMTVSTVSAVTRWTFLTLAYLARARLLSVTCLRLSSATPPFVPRSHVKVSGRVYLIMNRWVSARFLWHPVPPLSASTSTSCQNTCSSTYPLPLPPRQSLYADDDSLISSNIIPWI